MNQPRFHYLLGAEGGTAPVLALVRGGRWPVGVYLFLGTKRRIRLQVGI
jgi:hypothetical protein